MGEPCTYPYKPWQRHSMKISLGGAGLCDAGSARQKIFANDGELR